ncbi:MAG: SIMPL domain-containing protein [Gammaproteobacteria bacterium]|nr:SIMPL domain-containing protein [Gammaproteobacteria bacterium]
MKQTAQSPGGHWLAGTLPAALLGLALIVAAAIGGNALLDFKRLDRYVTVKGLAEQEVQADLTIWPISYTVTADSLNELQAQLEAAADTITAYLKLHAFSDQDLTRSPPRITDFYAQSYSNTRPPERYQAVGNITVQSQQITAVKTALQSIGNLLSDGIMLAQDYSFGGSAQFLYTSLNDIKPAMIADATANAREAARQFAKDSGSKVGGIRTANQGLFTITERDSNSPDVKIVRVVSTVQFYLRD